MSVRLGFREHDCTRQSRVIDFGDATPDIVAMLRSPANVFYEYAADNGDMLTKAADEITALRAKVKAQAEALKPFKPISLGFDTDRPEDTVLICTRLGLCLGTIKVSDLRRAAQEAGHE